MKTLSDVQATVRAAGFKKADEVVKIMYRSLIGSIGDNPRRTGGLFYGDPGWGKSDIARLVLGEFGDYEVIQMGPETQASTLFGGIDLAKWRDDGDLLMNFDNSPFVGKEFMLLEEFLSVPPDVGGALRDVITSGLIRHQKTARQIDTRGIIGVTNVSPDEFGVDASTEAVLARFPYRLRVGPETVILDDDDYKDIIFNGIARQAGMHLDTNRNRRDMNVVRDEVGALVSSTRDILMVGAIFRQNGIDPRSAEFFGQNLFLRAKVEWPTKNNSALLGMITGSFILDTMEEQRIEGAVQAKNNILEQQKIQELEKKREQTLVFVNAMADSVDLIRVPSGPRDVILSRTALRKVEQAIATLQSISGHELLDLVREEMDTVDAVMQAKKLAYTEAMQRIFGI